MKQSTCGAVFCQPGGDELKHDIWMMVQVSECSLGSQTIILKIIVSPQIHKTAQQM